MINPFLKECYLNDSEDVDMYKELKEFWTKWRLSKFALSLPESERLPFQDSNQLVY